MTDPMIPGLVVPGAAAGDSPMVVAAKRTLAELAQLRRVEPRHAVLVELVLSLAAAIDAGTRSGRASAVAMAAAQLRETMLVLDPPPEDGNAEADALARLEGFMAELDRAAAGGAA